MRTNRWARTRRFWISSLVLLFLAGCSSDLEQRCEKTNWFEHARDLALQGKYLEEDRFIHKCKKVDKSNATQMDLGFKSGRERYCTYESFRRNGESGEPVNYKMCDNLVLYQMQQRYGEGLRQFCTPQVARSFGESGKVYKNVCFKEQETKFLPAYFTARKAYLERSIAQTKDDLARTENLQVALGAEIQAIEREIYALPGAQECREIEVYDRATEKNHSALVCEEASYVRYRRSTLYGQIDPLRTQYADHARLMGTIRDHLLELETELTKIPVTAASASASIKP